MSEDEAGSVHYLSADDIFAAKDIEEKDVDVPEWGGSVKVRALSLRQIANVAQKAMRRNPQTGQEEMNREASMILTLQEGMIEPKLSVQDARKLAEKSATAVTRIVQAINALGPTAEAVAEAEKSVWAESDAPVPVRVGAGVGDDVGAPYNGHVNQ